MTDLSKQWCIMRRDANHSLREGYVTAFLNQVEADMFLARKCDLGFGAYYEAMRHDYRNDELQSLKDDKGADIEGIQREIEFLTTKGAHKEEFYVFISIEELMNPKI